MWKIAGHLAVAGVVFDCVLFCAVPFSHEMSWMRSGIELGQFLRPFLSTTDYNVHKHCLFVIFFEIIDRYI